METTAGIINGCVSSSILSASSFGKLKSCWKKTSTAANGGAGKAFRICCGSTSPLASDPYKILKIHHGAFGKAFRICCGSTSPLASDPYKILKIHHGAFESNVKKAFRELALKSTLKNAKGIYSSEAFIMVKDQIAKVEKDYRWQEKESHMKNDIADVFRQSSAVSDSIIRDPQMEIQKMIDGRKLIESKL